MANFKQFEFILGPLGLGQIRNVTGTKYNIRFFQIETPKAINRPLLPVDYLSIKNFVYWMDFDVVDADYTSLGFDWTVIQQKYIFEKGFLTILY